MRVGIGYRALAVDSPDGPVWFWIGSHAEYDRLIGEGLERADESSDVENSLLWFGQSAGLIDSVVPAADVVRQVVSDAEEILRQLPSYTTL